MAKEIKPATAGSLESNDILIMVDQGQGINIDLESVVKKQFGQAIEKTILEVIEEEGIKNISLKAKDSGALDYTIRARVKAAIRRGLNDL